MTVSVNKIGTALCKAFGLDEEKVAAISFKWHAGGLAKIGIESYVHDEDADKMMTVFNHYELKEKNETT